MKKTIYLALIVHCTFGVINCFSQVTQEWIARYNGPGNGFDWANFLAVDGLGNVYVTGYSTGSGTGLDYTTIKYNSTGVQQWAAGYNGPGNSSDTPSSLAVDSSGNVYVTGSSWGSGTRADYATIKYNSAGVQQWAARYDAGADDDIAYSLAVDGSGNIYVTGYSYKIGTGYDYATIKYNSTGVQLWAARYNGPGVSTDQAYSLAVDGLGNVYVAGRSFGSGTLYDCATIKYNSAGDSVWVKRYNGPGNNDDAAWSIAADGLGNVYVTGYSTGSGTGLDYATIKCNSAGVQQWAVSYNGPGNGPDWANSLAVDGSGNVYVTGYSWGNGTNYDYATIKYNSSGDSVWVKRYNGPGNDIDRAYSVAVDPSGNVYVTGWSLGTLNDYATIKYNSAGVQQWVARYNGPGNSIDQAYSLAVDGSGNVYVTGYSRSGSSSGTEDYATIKYSQTVGIKTISNEIPKNFSLSQNYPNPFNPVAKIKFNIPKSSFTSLNVYDILGKEVALLVNEQLHPGTYEVNWDALNYPSGVYFYKLFTNGFSDTKKMILAK